MKKKILIKKEEFGEIDLEKIESVEKVDVMNNSIEITFIIRD